MSNPVCVQRTIFIDQPSQEKAFGYRFYDNHSKGYENRQPESILRLDDLAFLAQVRDDAKHDSSNALRDILEFVREEQLGIEVDDNFYDWDQIKAILTGS